VIPFWNGDKVQGLVRCPLEVEGGRKYILAQDFPEGQRPLFIPGPFSGRGEIFLVESYVEALAVAATGRAGIAVGGTQLSDAQTAELRNLLREESRLYILPDHDNEVGAKAARTWARTFFPNAMICPASYGEGGEDIADTLAADGTEATGEHLDRLAKSAQDLIDIETKTAVEMEGGVREKLAYATANIVPLVTLITPDGMRDATADIVAEAVGLKKSWLNKAIKDEEDRLHSEHIQALMRETQEEIERKRAEHRARVEAAQDKIDALFAPGVLGRLRAAAARMHNVHGDWEPLELALLVALGAQLQPLPNGRPLGASILLTAEAGRGKNHIVDAAVKPLPEEFYFAFEIASGQSLYYKADEDPEFLKHTFAYPNEIEGAEALWDFLRPMLSKGRATKVVTAKDVTGNMTTRTIIVEGPVTIAIPTIRDKTDEQLQTRLLVAELPDYLGRVKQHSAAVSKLLLPDAAAADHSEEQFLWQEGLRQLTSVRKVVFALPHPDFALDDDQVSHGARLWANLLGLMSAHAWLEQKNRRLLDLGEGDGSSVVAIEATPDDYEAAYRIFIKVCKRTVVNLSDTHRKILGAIHELHGEFPQREAFTQREIAKGAGVALSTVSGNKTFLATSAKLIKETDAGLTLVEGAEPSWWAEGNLVAGLPTPEKVRAWWGELHDPPPGGAEHTEHAEHSQNSYNYAENHVRHPTEQASNMFGVSPTLPGLVRQVFGTPPNTENGIDKPKTDSEERVFDRFGVFGGSEGDDDVPASSKRRLTEEEARKVQKLIDEGT